MSTGQYLWHVYNKHDFSHLEPTSRKLSITLGPRAKCWGMNCSGEKEDSLLLIGAPPFKFASVASQPHHSSKAPVLILTRTLTSGMTSWLRVVSRHEGQDCGLRSGRQGTAWTNSGGGLPMALSDLCTAGTTVRRFLLHPTPTPVVTNQSKGPLWYKTDCKAVFLYCFN